MRAQNTRQAPVRRKKREINWRIEQEIGESRSMDAHLRYVVHSLH